MVEPTSIDSGAARNRTADDVSDVPTVRSFEAFCANEADRLARALAIALNNRELGRDAAAEALTRAWPRWGEVSAYDNPAGWVYRVGLNWGRSRLRRWRRETITEVFAEASEPAVEPDGRIAAAMRQLSTDHRAVVVGRIYLDWSEADLAAALDIPTGTVKSRLSRALAQLEQHLGASS
jgi:DNA-directed RNA polymerase specialized sigma24 family protein